MCLCFFSMVAAFRGCFFLAYVTTCLVVFGVFKIDRLYVGVSLMNIKFEGLVPG